MDGGLQEDEARACRLVDLQGRGGGVGWRGGGRKSKL